MNTEAYALPYVKESLVPHTLTHISFCIQKAFGVATSGRPGPVYLEFSEDLLLAPCTLDPVCTPVRPPAPSVPRQLEMDRCLEVWRKARKPLIVLGKGASYSHADTSIQQLINRHQVFFLPMGMAKGVVSDDHPLCVSPARSMVLRTSDVVLLIGCR
uniref:2-hydroxyacyl-CoA lyase 1 n=1 Tax=Lygus hesperus TaxID=30085 RepID=A0A0A9YS13_LYGHE